MLALRLGIPTIPKRMDPVLPILPIWGYEAIILGTLEVQLDFFQVLYNRFGNDVLKAKRRTGIVMVRKQCASLVLCLSARCF